LVLSRSICVILPRFFAQALPTTFLFHAEVEVEDAQQTGDPASYPTFLASRPPSSETTAIELVTRLQAAHPQLHTHIVHLSAAAALPALRRAKAAGLRITVETCFHYLCLAAEDVPHGHTEFKCCPPIREEENRQRLWDALVDGTIDFVVSDHSPCVASLKDPDGKGDFIKAWGGVSTLGLGLSLMWTECKARGIGIGRIVDWMSKRTAKHARLDGVKGEIGVGFDADFVVWDPNAVFEVSKENLHFKNKLSPYEGRTLVGRVEQTYLRGKMVYDRARGFDGISAQGRLL